MDAQIDFVRRAPPPDLAGAIRFFYRMRLADGGAAMLNHPQGAVDLVLVLSGGLRFDKGPGSTAVSSRATAVIPLQTSYFRFAFAAGTEVLGVAFEPLGYRQFLDFPQQEFPDRCVDAEAAGDVRRRRLRERLHELGPPRDMAHLVAWLRSRRRAVGSLPRLAGALARLPELASAGASIADVGAELAVSPRTLQRLFRSELGISPKAALRLARFQTVLRSLRSGRDVGWADLSVASGYFDQAHLSNEFRVFTGLAPTRFLERHPPLAEAFDCVWEGASARAPSSSVKK